MKERSENPKISITELRIRALNSEVQMIDDFNFFEQKVLSFKQDLYLNPYASLKDIILWCEVLIKYEKQIDILSSEIQEKIQKITQKIQSKTIREHFSTDEKTIMIWSDYILELLDIEKKYKAVLFGYCLTIDNCIKYVCSYLNDLLDLGVTPPHIMEKVKKLGTTHWISTRSKKIEIIGEVK